MAGRLQGLSEVQHQHLVQERRDKVKDVKGEERLHQTKDVLVVHVVVYNQEEEIRAVIVG